MSLLSEAMSGCTLINETIVSDGYGGYKSVYQDGVTFQSAIYFNSSIEARRAENEGVHSLYTVVTPRNFMLKYHMIFRRERDKKIFRVTSDGDDQHTPKSTDLDMRNAVAEEWELTNE